VTSLATAGTHNLVAQYEGSATYQASSSVPLTMTVGGATPDFTLSATPSSLAVSAGQNVTTTVSVAPLNGSTQTVTLACSGLPAFATCGFSPATTTLNGTTAAAVTVTVRTNVVAVLMARARDVLLAGPGAAGALLLALMMLGALPSLRLRRTALLLCAGLALAACSSKGSGDEDDPGAITPAGSYTVTITATSGTTSHSTSVALTVQ
jgi:hypothetical protein